MSRWTPAKIKIQVHQLFWALIDGTVPNTQNLSLVVDDSTVILSNNAGSLVALGDFSINNDPSAAATQVDLANVQAKSITIKAVNTDLQGTLYSATQDGVEFTGAVDLDAPGVATIQIQSGGGADDNIIFGSTIDGSVAGQQSLIVESGEGSVTVSGAIGASDAASPLGQLDINSTTQASTASGPIAINNIGTENQAGVAGNADIGNSETSSIDFDGSVYNVGGDFTFATNAGAEQTFVVPTEIIATGNLSFDSIVLQGNDVDLTITTIGKDIVVGNISAIDFDPNDILTRGNVTLSTGVVAGEIISTDGMTNVGDVYMEAGPNTISLSGVYTPASYTAAVNVELTSDVVMDTSAANGDITFQQEVNRNAAPNVDFTLDAGTGDIQFDEAVGAGTSVGGAFTIAGATQVDLNSVIAGSIDVTADNIDLNGTTYRATSPHAGSGDITFSGPTDLDLGAGTITVSSGGQLNDFITFNDTVNDNIAGETNLTLNSIAGSILFCKSIVGNNIPIGSVVVNSVRDMNIDSAFNSTDFTQFASTGTLTIDGAVNTTGATGVALTGTNFALNSTIDTDGDGVVTTNFTGTTAIAAAGVITADGAVTLRSAGGISTAGNVTTSADDITFQSAVDLTGANTLYLILLPALVPLLSTAPLMVPVPV